MCIRDSSSTHPDNNRGNIDGFEEGYDSKGRRSLYLTGDVGTEKDLDVLKSNDISILAPSRASVAGVKWGRHVKNALVTGYPRVKDLEPFTLALSETEEETQREDLHEMTAEDYVDNLRRHGSPSRNILDAIVRANPTGLLEVLAGMEPPKYRFEADDHAGIDGAAYSLAETNGVAWVVPDDETGEMLVLAEEHPDAVREVLG